MKLFLYFLWILINFKPTDIFFQNIRWYIYKIEISIYSWLPIFLWNQGLVNLGFDDNKIRFKTNDYISSVIRQDDFQSGNHKDKSSQRAIIKKKKTSKRSVFQDPSFIRSLCKVVSVLEFSCITFFIYALKSSKSYFVLNILKLDDFMFSTKTLCQMFFKLVLKVLSWKSWLLSQKRLNRLNRMRNRSTSQFNRSRSAKNFFSLLERLFNRSRLNLN